MKRTIIGKRLIYGDYNNNPLLKYEVKDFLTETIIGESLEEARDRRNAKNKNIKEDKEKEVMKILSEVLLSNGIYLKYSQVDANGKSKADFDINWNGEKGICELTEVLPMKEESEIALRKEHPFFRKHVILSKNFNILEAGINIEQLNENIKKAVDKKNKKNYVGEPNKTLVVATIKHTSDLIEQARVLWPNMSNKQRIDLLKGGEWGDKIKHSSFSNSKFERNIYMTVLFYKNSKTNNFECFSVVNLFEK